MLTLAFVVGITFGAYAEVQNVKVGGEILMQALHQKNFGLSQSTTMGDKENDTSNRLITHVQINVSADLTDNVGVVVKLLNERAWGLERIPTDTNGDVSSTSIDLDLAYVTLKEFLYSPLTLKIGRQAVKFGNGLVIGSGTSATNLASGDTARATNYANGVPKDQRLRKSMDAMRATLDYDPLTVDLLYAKIEEGPNTDRNDNVDVYGINAAYKFNKKASVQGYVFSKVDGKTAEAITGAAPRKGSQQIHTIGILGYLAPIANLKTSLELAGQLGNRTPTSTDTASKRRAYAIQAMADYTFKGKKFDPALGATFTYLSGDNQRNDEYYRNWDTMQEGQAPNIFTNHFSMTSCVVTNLRGKMKPVDDVTLSANYGYYHFPAKLNEVGLSNAYSAQTLTMTKSKDGGSALDLFAKYDYTEDVQIGLDIGTFFPGKAFSDARSAVSVMPYLKVTF
ncbi:MAG: alginate export family protein [Candidatus Omnitrophica bacterium]|nr:alginate export family protein [Candidatus Omnitrophota bacterium]MBU1929180.1 alginate export family protein [Candidatus Omnitrophota bacterium]